MKKESLSSVGFNLSTNKTPEMSKRDDRRFKDTIKLPLVKKCAKIVADEQIHVEVKKIKKQVIVQGNC